MHPYTRKYFLISFIILILASCIDPYVPDLENYESLLVVDGLLTDEEASYTIQLSRTMEDENSEPERISDAEITVTDQTGNTIFFRPAGNGIYITEPGSARGQAGNTYILHIRTADGSEYESDPCEMLPVPGIDRVYFDRDSELSADKQTTYQGISIYVDTDPSEGNNSYVRWEYQETWKFNVPYPRKYNYLNDSTFIPLNNIKDVCWKTNLSDRILTGSVLGSLSNGLKKKNICFIGSDRSDRLSLRYSIEVKQYSVSPGEFDYWNMLKQVNEMGGDIFDSQPFPVAGNIHNINDPDEQVLGYFQVSAAKVKRIYISPGDISEYELPGYKNDCSPFIVSPENYPPPNPAASSPTFDDIYNMFIQAGGFTFVEPQINPVTKKLEKLVFAPTGCSDCEMTGVSQKPDFWTDL